MSDFSPWQHYWQTMNAHACVRDANAEYRAEIQQFWLNKIQQCRTSERVLDICAGNGAVARLAIQASDAAKLALTVHAIDGAKVNQQYIEQDALLRRVNFLDDVNITALPYTDLSFDLVTSQYGIEYALNELAIAEVARVIKSQGRFISVCHDANGTSVVAAKNALQYLDRVLDTSQFFTTLKLYIQQVTKEGQNASASTELQNLDAQLIAAKRIVDEGAQSVDTADITSNVIAIVGHMLANMKFLTVEAMLNKVDDLQNSLNMHRKRLLLCVESALTDAKKQDFVNIAASQQLLLKDDNALHDNQGALLARVLVFEKTH